MARLAIRMPKMSMTMTEGEVNEWMVRVGDQVDEGDVVCEVMTDKVDMEVESEVEGTVTRLVAQEGDVIVVGGELGFVESSGDEGLGDLSDLLS